ncbi:MAG: STAS domain-containing protein [Proteobacteria bacterium]|nr:STAS domain-containing protein [Pseudomonadota bacterium]
MRKKKVVTHIDILGDLSIFNAGEQRSRLLDALEAYSEVEVDLSGVSEIDSAGIQLMVAAKREAVNRNKSLRFTNHSPAVFDILELCDLAGHLGDPLLIHAPT